MPLNWYSLLDVVANMQYSFFPPPLEAVQKYSSPVTGKPLFCKNMKTSSIYSSVQQTAGLLTLFIGSRNTFSCGVCGT